MMWQSEVAQLVVGTRVEADYSEWYELVATVEVALEEWWERVGDRVIQEKCISYEELAR